MLMLIADVVWPALFLEMRLIAWWVILVGLLALRGKRSQSSLLTLRGVTIFGDISLCICRGDGSGGY